MTAPDPLIPELQALLPAGPRPDRASFGALIARADAFGFSYPPLFWGLAEIAWDRWIRAASVSRFLANEQSFDAYRGTADYLIAQELPIPQSLAGGIPIFDQEDGSYDVLVPDGRILGLTHESYDIERLVAPSLARLLEVLVTEMKAERDEDPSWLARGASPWGLRRARGTEAIGPWFKAAGRKSLGEGTLLDALATKTGSIWVAQTEAEVLRGNLVMGKEPEYCPVPGKPSSWHFVHSPELVVLDVEALRSPFDPPPRRALALKISDPGVFEDQRPKKLLFQRIR